MLNVSEIAQNEKLITFTRDFVQLQLYRSLVK